MNKPNLKANQRPVLLFLFGDIQAERSFFKRTRHFPAFSSTWLAEGSGTDQGKVREGSRFFSEIVPIVFGKNHHFFGSSSGSVRENARFVREFFGEASAAAEGFPNRSGSLPAAH